MLDSRARARAGVCEAGWAPDAAGGARFSLLLDGALAPSTGASLRRFLGGLLRRVQARARARAPGAAGAPGQRGGAPAGAAHPPHGPCMARGGGQRSAPSQRCPAVSAALQGTCSSPYVPVAMHSSSSSDPSSLTILTAKGGPPSGADAR